jgi:hypothetical protein
MAFQKPQSFGQWELITPESADRLVGTIVKDHERPRSQRLVARYAEEMREGAWNSHSPFPIVIDTNQNLIDGQHRLQAVVESGIPQYFFVHRHVDPSVKECLDIGKKRTNLDLLRQAGHTEATGIRSPVLNKVMEASGIIPWKQPARPSQRSRAWLRFGDNIIWSEARLKMFRNVPIITPMVLALDQGVPREAIQPYRDIFRIDFIPEDDYRLTQPILMRRRVEQGHDSLRTGNPANSHRFLKISTRVLHYYLRGTPLSMLKEADQDDFLKFYDSYRVGVKKGLWK